MLHKTLIYFNSAVKFLIVNFAELKNEKSLKERAENNYEVKTSQVWPTKSLNPEVDGDHIPVSTYLTL